MQFVGRKDIVNIVTLGITVMNALKDTSWKIILRIIKINIFVLCATNIITKSHIGEMSVKIRRKRTVSVLIYIFAELKE